MYMSYNANLYKRSYHSMIGGLSCVAIHPKWWISTMKTVMMTVITKVVATVLRAILKVAFTPEVSRVVKAEHRDFFL